MRLKWQHVGSGEWRAGDYLVKPDGTGGYVAYYQPEVVPLEELREPLDRINWRRLEPGICLNQDAPFLTVDQAQRACERHMSMLAESEP